LWQQVIIDKYGGLVIGRVELGEESKPWFASSWWRDICSMGINLDRNWFAQGVFKELGNGAHTRFWEDVWVGEEALRQRFPRLFSISNQHNGSVASMRDPEAANGWNFRWRRRLFEWESTLFNELLLLINSASLTDAEDRWGWRPDEGKSFTVKSAYDIVSDMLLPKEYLSTAQDLSFKVLWKCMAPSKVTGFAWLVLLDRVPTRVNLIRRQVIIDDMNQCCVFCGNSAETVTHLFLYCNCILQVWERVLAWLGLMFLLPHSISSLLNFMAMSTGSKQVRKGLVMIWKAVIWTVWRQRNKKVFENEGIDLARLIDDVKTISWKWWVGRSNVAPVLLYEWVSEPLICLSRG
jgi:hypothetical protein